jgi:hypothetical protein
VWESVKPVLDALSAKRKTFFDRVGKCMGVYDSHYSRGQLPLSLFWVERFSLKRILDHKHPR